MECTDCLDSRSIFDFVSVCPEVPVTYWPTDDESVDPFQEFTDEYIEQLRNIALNTVLQEFPGLTDDEDIEDWVNKFVTRMESQNIGSIRKFLRRAFWHDADFCICPAEPIRLTLMGFAQEELNDGTTLNLDNYVFDRERDITINYPSDDEYDSEEDSVDYSESDIDQIKKVANKTVSWYYPTCRQGERDEWVERFVRRMKHFRIATIDKLLEQAGSRFPRIVFRHDGMRLTLCFFAEKEQNNATANPPGQPE